MIFPRATRKNMIIVALVTMGFMFARKNGMGVGGLLKTNSPVGSLDQSTVAV